MHTLSVRDAVKKFSQMESKVFQPGRDRTLHVAGFPPGDQDEADV